MSNTLKFALVVNIILIVFCAAFYAVETSLDIIENESRAQFNCKKDVSVKTFDEYQDCKTKELNRE